jgi:UDP-N-acetylmuramate--alanine ligase
MTFRKINNIFFVGIGGIGMSGIAELLSKTGFTISGSDLNENENVKRLRDAGIDVKIGHKHQNISKADLIVYSSAIPKTNPELVMARKNKVPIIKRAEMLGELISLKETSIAVGGTHGKTTTSSMIGSVLNYSQKDPTLIIGGLVQNIKSNTKIGSSDLIVVEADEYDRSFLALKPTIAIITNIELEHIDCYRDIKDLKDAFIQFAKSVPFYGEVIVCLDSPFVKEILKKIERPIITYGFSNHADYQAKNIEFKGNYSKFDIYFKGEKVEKIKLNVPGEHNILNALASIALSRDMDIPFNTIKEGLLRYQGVRRRFDIKGVYNQIMIVDDYAHHPTEITATLSAAKNGWDKRIIAVFQPHLFTRTLKFYKQFSSALEVADLVIITDIYPARETPIDGVSSKLIFNELKKKKTDCFYVPNLNDLEKKLDNILKINDLLITLGAGTIWRYNNSYTNHLQKKSMSLKK